MTATLKRQPSRKGQLCSIQCPPAVRRRFSREVARYGVHRYKFLDALLTAWQQVPKADRDRAVADAAARK